MANLKVKIPSKVHTSHKL